MHSFRQQFTVSLGVVSDASSTGNSFRPEPTLPFDAAFIATSRRQYDTYLIPIFYLHIVRFRSRSSAL